MDTIARKAKADGMRNALTGRPAVELIVPVLDQEADIGRRLDDAAACLRKLSVPASIAVVDRGSSDRTVESVDEMMAGCAVPIRVLGCSAPGWGRAVLRGVTTSAARWVACGDPEAFSPAVAPVLDHALRLLRRGDHVVRVTPDGRSRAVLETSVAALLFGGQLPVDPGCLPEVKDLPEHAGIRTVTVTEETWQRDDGDRETVLEMVAR
jgi:hypothetical protein